jgi:homoserine O-acetyltransferase/O-succinyltransferase
MKAFMKSNHKIFYYNDIFQLESGSYLPGFRLAYTTYGSLNYKKDNVIWVVHALTANADPLEWWPDIVGPGCPVDTERYFVVCANCLGSHYGSTGPLSVNPEKNEPYYYDFPFITIRDIVKGFDLLRSHLGIDRIKLLIGASMGGQQALEWSISGRDLVEYQVLIATNARHSPWGIAFNESQRMAIELSHDWGVKHPEAGLQGMKTARSVALLSYRTYNGYKITQEDSLDITRSFRASSYQRYQGEKLAMRFNAFSYYILTKAMDSHNAGRGREGCENALRSVTAKTSVISIASDLLFPPSEQQYLATHIPAAILEIIDSDLGHDGFLTEGVKVGKVISSILNDDNRNKTSATGQLKATIL